MYKIDWDNVQEATDFDNPQPGAYIGVICRVEDIENKEYLLIEWDFAEGNYKGNNLETFERAGFWPIQLRRSYKPKALRFLKAFKTALEESNPGYYFNELDLRSMVGKRIGIVLGEEEYTKKDGSTGKRLYVAQTRSIQSIQKGDFKVPELKRLNGSTSPGGQVGSGGFSWPAASKSSSAFSGFQEVEENDWEIPF